MFTPIGDLIKTLPKRSHAPAVILALLVRKATQESIAENCQDIPGEILKKITMKSFKNKTLTIIAPGLASTELQMRASGLKKDINQRLGKKVVSELRFKSF